MTTDTVMRTDICPYCWCATGPRGKGGWPCLRCNRVLTQRELKLDKRSVVAHPLESTSEEVARLLRSQREDRVRRLIDASMFIVEMSREVHGRGKSIEAEAVLFSGGNDSSTLLHMMHTYGSVTHTVHANTGISVKQTNQFVRDASAHYGIPLIERSPPAHRSYEALVLREGFPGPAKHYKVYQWIKESALDLARIDLGVHQSRTKRALYIAGRRREESERRSDIAMFEADGSVIWVSPMVPWTKLDLNTYRLMHPDVMMNDVCALIHHSGECGCGSFAKPGELEEWGDWFPEFRAEVERLEALIADRPDIPEERKTWGWGAYRGSVRPPRRTGMLCSSCQIPRSDDRPQLVHHLHPKEVPSQRKEEVMTTQDTSSFFTTHQSRDVPRDQWGRYKLPGPDGTEESWTRATTLAATMAEQYGLSIWHQRQVVWGLSRRPDLITMASTIAGPEDKKALGEIVKEAHIAAGTQAKANRGTAIHSATAAAERGAFDQVPEELRPHVAGYFAELKRQRLEVIPEYVERTVIVPEYQTAGTFDNLLRCPDGKIRVGDKKTGRMDYSDIEFAIQMSLYANASAMFNYDTGQYEPMPEIAKDYAILMVIDPETGHCEAQRINIAWGWMWARTAFEVMAIRKTKAVITPLIPPEVNDTLEPLMRDLPGPGAPIADTLREHAGLQASMRDGTFTTPPANYVFGQPVPENALVRREHDGTFTVPGGYVDSTSPVAAEYQAFWSDDRHAEDFEPDATVNGVPLEQYGQPSPWGCSRGEPCEFTGDDGLHSDGTVCLYGNARPGPIPPMPVGEQEPVPGEAPELDGDQPSNLDDIATKMNKLSKAQAQTAARAVMTAVGLTEGQPGGIKLSQYKAKIVNETIALAQRHSISIPNPKDPAAPFGVPFGSIPTDSASGAGAPAQKAKGDAGATGVPAQQPDDQRDEKIRTAVESIRQQNSIEGLQERHAYYSRTSIGWTEEMQNAARVRAAELDHADGATSLTPMEMIQGATSRETLTKAWQIATASDGWTEELNAAAMAKEAELAQRAGVAPSGNQQ